MLKYSRIAAAALLSLTIAACSGNDGPDAGDVTETRMDDVDVIDGTISDDMVDVDTIQKTDPTGAEEEASSDAKKEKDAAPADEKESAEKPAE
ncbi:MAG: hypothetical protein ACI9TB_002986 [Parasphingorhabdus sp.]|jgi:hypothetical protein|uniref:hypothetical protein n=1 Tax=Parasphingorhabdus sp. TaxID=2709688 RepID=UPI0039E47481